MLLRLQLYLLPMMASHMFLRQSEQQNHSPGIPETEQQDRAPLHCCQSYKVMQRKVSEQTIDAVTGKRVSKGNRVKYNRGDLVLTDCNVTGSNYGTPTKPKFPLMALS